MTYFNPIERAPSEETLGRVAVIGQPQKEIHSYAVKNIFFVGTVAFFL